MPKRRTVSPKIKGFIGFFGVLVIFAAVFIGVVRFENNARAKELEASAQETLQQQCYTPTTAIPFTTGDKEVDAAFSWLITNPEKAQKTSDEIQNLIQNSIYDTGSFRKTDIFKLAQDSGVSPQPGYQLTLSPSGQFNAQPNTDSRAYTMVTLPREQAQANLVASLKFMGASSEKTYLTQVLVPLSDKETSTEPLTIPVLSWDEKATGDNFSLVEVAPTC